MYSTPSFSRHFTNSCAAFIDLSPAFVMAHGVLDSKRSRVTTLSISPNAYDAFEPQRVDDAEPEPECMEGS
jgi:hypothetical protein